MKSSRLVSSNNFGKQVNLRATPNTEMLSRQIESLRIVMRRMKSSQSTALDSLISQKLKDLQ